MKKLVTLLAIFALSITAFGQYPDHLEKPFNDFAGVIPADKAESFNNQLKALEDSDSTQFAVVVFPELQGNLEETANKLFRQWGIGQKGKDNGLIFFIFLKDENGKGKTRFETGRGLEGVLPDSLSNRIYMDKIRPLLKNKDYTGGIQACITSITQVIKGEYKNDKPASASGSTDLGDFIAQHWLAILIILIIILILLIMIGSSGGGFSSGGGYYSGSSSSSWGSSSSDSGSSSWGGGGSSDGGGSSGDF